MSRSPLPLTMALRRPWWRALIDGLRFNLVDRPLRDDRREVGSDQTLDGLSPATLKDIGAPPWLQARHDARREIEGARSRAVMPW